MRVLPEQRTRVGVTGVRVPDLSIVPLDTPNELVRVTPPIICIEILSPEDRLARTVRVLKDYLDMGVTHLWFFDPIDRDVLIFIAQGLKPFDQRRIDIPNSPRLPRPRSALPVSGLRHAWLIETRHPHP